MGSLLYKSLVRRAVREGNGEGAYSYLTTWVGVAELEGFDFFSDAKVSLDLQCKAGEFRFLASLPLGRGTNVCSNVKPF